MHEATVPRIIPKMGKTILTLKGESLPVTSTRTYSPTTRAAEHMPDITGIRQRRALKRERQHVHSDAATAISTDKPNVTATLSAMAVRYITPPATARSKDIRTRATKTAPITFSL